MFSAFGYHTSGAMLRGVWQGAICPWTSRNESLPWTVRKKHCSHVSFNVKFTACQKRGRVHRGHSVRDAVALCHTERTLVWDLWTDYIKLHDFVVISFKNFDQLMDLDLTLDLQYKCDPWYLTDRDKINGTWRNALSLSLWHWLCSEWSHTQFQF